MERVGEPGEIVEGGVAEGDVEAQGVAAGLADLARLELGELVDVVAEPGGHLAHDLPALAGRAVTPIAGKALRGAGNGRVDLGPAAGRDLGELATCRRFDDRERRGSGRRLEPVAVDEGARGPCRGRDRAHSSASAPRSATGVGTSPLPAAARGGPGSAVCDSWSRLVLRFDCVSRSSGSVPPTV